jgi:hypothetical protein
VTTHPATSAPSPPGRAVPPVTQLAMGSLALVIIGGIYMVGTYASGPMYAIPTGLLIGSAALWLVSLLLLSRHQGFAWPVFRQVAGWALLAYALIAAMIEFSFIHNNVTGTPLLLLSLMLVMFALTVPLSIGFTVARFETTSAG